MSIQSPNRQRGATLIEVLIALVVLAIGLLGLAGLQATSIQSNQSAYQRSQATLLAYDIAERMRANRTEALASSSAYVSSSFPTSSSSHSVSGSQAQKDLAEWLNKLALTLPSGTGQIQKNGNLFTISVRWNDNRGRIAKSDAQADADTVFIYRTEI